MDQCHMASLVEGQLPTFLRKKSFYLDIQGWNGLSDLGMDLTFCPANVSSPDVTR